MSSYVTRKTPGDTAWYVHDRFGMFIHFGIYSMASRSGGIKEHGCEWLKSDKCMSEEEYDRYFKLFDPDLYDPTEWAKQAKAAGMKYVVMTAKHHDGFCLFDSKYTDYKVTNTPCGRDLIKEYAEAFRAEGIRVGLYYSLLDWHHPDFTLDRFHPRRNDENAEEINAKRDMKRYTKYMRDQVEELLTNYGKIDIIWYDFSYTLPPRDKTVKFTKGKGKEDWEAEELIALTRKLQPGIIIDNRTGIEQDIITPEQFQMHEWPRHEETGELVLWEACQTFSGSWAYDRDEFSWKSPDMLLRMLVTTVSCGGNFIMNVGPTPRGYLDYRTENSLKVFADWMKYNSRSIYGCTMAEPEFTAPEGCRLTQSEDGKRLYIHLCEYPFAHLGMRNLAGKIEYAQFLHDGSEITYTEGEIVTISNHITVYDDMVDFIIPTPKPNCEIPVIEVFLK